jgi:hypothetical protein
MDKLNYYKQAGKEVFNILLLLCTIISLALGFQTVALIGLILEVAYMLIVPNLGSYQKYINYKSNHQEEINANPDRKQLILSLPFEIRNKSEKLDNKYNEIMKLAAKKSDLKLMMSKELEQLDFLLTNYIEFSTTLASYREYLSTNNVETIKIEINNLQHRIKSSFDNLKNENDLDFVHKRMQKRTLMQNNLTILEKRAEKVKQIKSTADTLLAELDVIEDTFYLISDHIVTFTPGDSLNIDLNSIIHSVENTDKIVKDTHREMDKLKKMNIQRISEL